MQNHSIRLAGKYLCELAEVSEDHGKEVFIEGPDGGTYLVLLRRGGQLFAYHNACPHQGRPMNWATDQFLIDKRGLLVCAHHGASFSIESGHCVAGPCEGAQLKAVPLEIGKHHAQADSTTPGDEDHSEQQVNDQQHDD